MRKFLSVLLAILTLLSFDCVASPKINTYHLEQAVRFIEANDYASAMNNIDKHIDKYPKDADGLFVRAILYSMNNNEKAIADLNAAISYHNKKSQCDKYTLYGFRADIYKSLYQFEKAIKDYNYAQKSYSGSHTPYVLQERADCYNEIGKYDLAVRDYADLIDIEPTATSYAYRGTTYRLAGNYDDAIADFTTALEKAPQMSWALYARGWCYELMRGSKQKALADYNRSIEIDSAYAYVYLNRGRLLQIMGDSVKALLDFEKILELDTVVHNNSCRHYALMHLGKNTKAKEWMNQVITHDKNNRGNYYDAACLYAGMGLYKESISYLRKALEFGYRSFKHIEYDDDLDPVRNMPEFIQLIKEYSNKR